MAGRFPLSPSPAPREREGPTPQAWEGEGCAASYTLTRPRALPSATLSRGAGEGNLARHPVSPPLERARRTLLGEGARRLLEILGQIELERRGDELRLAGQPLHVPAPGAHGGTHRQRRVFRDLQRQLARHVEVFVGWRQAVDDAGLEGFLGGKEAPCQRDLVAERGGGAVLEQRPIARGAEPARRLGQLQPGALG